MLQAQLCPRSVLGVTASPGGEAGHRDTACAAVTETPSEVLPWNTPHSLPFHLIFLSSLPARSGHGEPRTGSCTGA